MKEDKAIKNDLRAIFFSIFLSDSQKNAIYQCQREKLKKVSKNNKFSDFLQKKKVFSPEKTKNL